MIPGSMHAGVLVGLLVLGAPAFAHDDSPPLEEVTGDLGHIDFPNSGARAAQPAFLRGVLLLHSFEFDAARKAFQDAEKADPAFALAYWGEALSYNMPIWGEQDLDAARAALAKLAPTAVQRRARAPDPRERDYLASAEQLYGEGDKLQRDARYSVALGEMARKYPNDLDARAFYALSLMALTGTTRNTANYMRAAAEAEAVYALDNRHPGALHYLIHAYDDPVHAPLGLRAARQYGQVARGASHAQHMPSHIFFALGLWDEAIAANVASLKTARDAGHGGYHPLVWLAYAYLQEGRRDDALPLIGLVAADVARSPGESNRASLAYARAIWLVETGGADAPGAWDSVASEGIVSILEFAANDFARGIVAAGQGHLEEARAAHQQLQQRVAAARGVNTGVTANRYATVTSEEIAHGQTFVVALQGVITFASGEREAGVRQVQEAIAREEQMEFEYGPPWSVKPLDELLGEMLLTLGRRDEAAVAFENSLRAHPNRRLSAEGLSASRSR